MAADRPVTFVIVGASGDLATRKIYPALFALDARGLLPPNCQICGYGRTAMTSEALRVRLAPRLVCDDLDARTCSLGQSSFLERCHYVAGDYTGAGFQGLVGELQRLEGPIPAPRIFYLAIPPTVFPDVVTAIGAAGLASCSTCDPWARVVIEKPFGRDRTSSDVLTREVRRVFDESQTYRIDHYLGKEVIQDLMVLRFANTILEPIWNRQYVRHVHVAWSEDLALEGRAGYFDSFGILRDVMQNHLTQILALIAMESPWEPSAGFVQDEKVRLLRQVPPLKLENLVVGQYVEGHCVGQRRPGYRDEPGVPPDSRTPTYAAAVLEVKSPRWRGVPFLLSAGKGLGSRHTEIRVHFRTPDNDWYRRLTGQAGVTREAGASPVVGLTPNEVVIRVQPEEQIFVSIVNKIPGLGLRLGNARLDLRYGETYRQTRIADAYENLLLDVVRGDRSLFIRDDELEAAWDVFTPALQALEVERIVPHSYAFGSAGPDAVDALAARFGIEDARFA